MPDGRLVTIDGQAFEVLFEAPGRTSLFLVNRTQKARDRVTELEQLLAAARAELARVEAAFAGDQDAADTTLAGHRPNAHSPEADATGSP